jgi:3-deoxy-D-manno-octulosonic-acid transferase
LVNARLSEKSAAGYKRVGALSKEMLSGISCIAAQAQPDADRFIALGVDSQKVTVTGSLKFDVELPDVDSSSLPELFRQIKNSNRQVLIAASTREGEDEKVLSAFRQCLEQEPSLLLVLVPRHPERFDDVARLCEAQQLDALRRSSDISLAEETQVIIGDSMGEMWLYFSLADIAFVGGSLVNTGCHNVLEPAAMGIPILVGPSQFNFESICDQLRLAGALITVVDENDLAQNQLHLLSHPEKRSEMGIAGRKLVESNKGSLEKLKVVMEEQLKL